MRPARIILSLFLIISPAYVGLIGYLAFAAPTRPAPKQTPTPKQTPPPATATEWESNWGTVKQLGKAISISGHPVWFAEGHIRADGSVYLCWTLRATEEPCPGVYKVTGAKEFSGTWGRSTSVKVEEDGSLSGETSPDRVYEVMAMEPEPF